jgi:hypothetical protein
MAKGIPALPVHDSIIVQGGYELHAVMALDRPMRRGLPERSPG